MLAAVAQLDRVGGYEPLGRGFESSPPHQSNSLEPEITGFRLKRVFLFLLVYKLNNTIITQ